MFCTDYHEVEVWNSVRLLDRLEDEVRNDDDCHVQKPKERTASAADQQKSFHSQSIKLLLQLVFQLLFQLHLLHVLHVILIALAIGIDAGLGERCSIGFCFFLRRRPICLLL